MKKIIMSLLLLTILIGLSSVNATIELRFSTFNDSSGDWINEPNAYDSSTSTYAYDNDGQDYLDLFFGSDYDDALLSKEIIVNLGMSTSAPFTGSIGIFYIDSKEETIWKVKTVDSGIYSYNTDETITLDGIYYVHGVRITSGVRTLSKIYDVRVIHYCPKSSLYCATTKYYDVINYNEYYNSSNGNCTVNSTVDFEYNFSQYNDVYGLPDFNIVLDHIIFDNCNCSSGCSGFYYWNYTNENITINFTLNLETLTETNTTSVNETSWFNLMGVLTFDEEQFFLVIMLGLWLTFLAKCFSNKTSFFGILQFVIAMPLFLYMVSISYLNNLSYGYLVSGAIMFASILTLILDFYR